MKMIDTKTLISEIDAKKKSKFIIEFNGIINMKKINKVEGVDLPGKLFGEIATKYADRVGGYTRIIKKGPRKGDAAEVVILELV